MIVCPYYTHVDSVDYCTFLDSLDPGCVGDLVVRDDPLSPDANRIMQLANIGGRIITPTNPLPVTSSPSSDIALDGFKINDVDADASPNFYGFTDKGGGWFILEETLSAGADTYRYARGNDNYITNWTNRVGLTYKYYFDAF